MARTPVDVAAAQVAAAYTAAGLRAVVDVRDLNPPAAWIALDTITGFSLDAQTYTATWHVYLTAANAGTNDALAELGRLLDVAAGVFPPTGAPIRVVGVQLPAGGDPVPALDLTITTRVTPD